MEAEARLPRQPYELEPHSDPETREEAIAMARKWAHGWSHWNEMAEAQDHDDASSVVLASAMTHVADTAMVQRYVALAQVLPSAEELHGVAP